LGDVHNKGAAIPVSTFFMYVAKNGDSALTPEQSRAARGWLGWSQTELARRANISISTVRDFETGRRTPIANNVEAMRRAIQSAGLRLIFDRNGAAAGILRQDADPDLSGDAPA